MKLKLNLSRWLALTLTLSVLLGACTPAANPITPDYPAGETPSEESPTEQPQAPTENPYPVNPTEPAGAVMDAAGTVPYDANPAVDEAQITTLTTASLEFAVDLYRALSQNNADGNLFYSPYSIFQALLMTSAGARGQTAAQMANVLHVSGNSDEVHQLMNALNLKLSAGTDTGANGTQPLELTIANALWGQKDFAFEEAFLNTLSANYNAGLKLIDFSDPEQARQLINAWVAAQTNDRIRDLIPQGVLNEMTRLVLTNAVYFKARWAAPFDPAMTKEEIFYALSGAETPALMMHGNLSTGALQTDAFQAVRLPYEGGSYAMILIMPTKGDLAAFESSLSGDSLEAIISQLSSSRANVSLAMPKFEFESSFGLGETLAVLGMSDAFDPQLADFSGMRAEKDLYLQSVVHKAFVKVDENGTEAAAATAVAVGMTSMPTESYDLRFDHPFMVVIEGQGTILFMGRVAQP